MHHRGSYPKGGQAGITGGFLGGSGGKESACKCRRPRFDSWMEKIPRRRKWQPVSVFLSGESHGQRSLVGCRPWGREESDTTERLHFRFSLSCIGEGNGNLLQLLEPTVCLKGSQASCAVWIEDSGFLSRPCRKRRPSSRDDRGVW